MEKAYIAAPEYWDFLLNKGDLLDLLEGQSCVEVQTRLFKSFVQVVNVETSKFCNRVCSYCPVSLGSERKSQGYMDDEVLIKLVDELSMIDFNRVVSLNLYNEPLADPRIVDKVELFRSRLPRAYIVFNSNGDYLTPELLDRLSGAGLNSIMVTLHPSPKRGYSFEDRMRHFRVFAKKIGAVLDVEIGEGGQLSSAILWRGMSVRVMANNWSEFGNSRAGAVKFLDQELPREAPCIRPFREFTVSVRGEVFPCCQFYPDDIGSGRYSLGNVGVESIFSVYSSRMFASWRSGLLAFGPKGGACKGCRDRDFARPESALQRRAILKRIMCRASGTVKSAKSESGKSVAV